MLNDINGSLTDQVIQLELATKLASQQINIAADDTLFLYFYPSQEIRIDVSCESSA